MEEVRPGRKNLSNLRDQVFWGKTFAEAQERLKMFPTPRASEYKDSGPVGSKSHSHMLSKDYLCAVVKEPDKPSGMLNPTWVEWLQGYPTGWTEVD